MTSERIAAAAVRSEHDGHVHTLPPPARHHTILMHWQDVFTREREWWRTTSTNQQRMVTRPHVQGFITSTGRFVDRIEAAAIAIAAKQVARLSSPPQLYSEDLW